MMPTTQENLNEAFSGESQAFQKYSAFSKKAEQEGFRNIAKLFRLTAEAEKIHAEGHLKAGDNIGSTLQNLQAAVAGETYEYTTMYPPMAALAAQDRHKAERMFTYAKATEKVHADLYSIALEAVKKGIDLDVSDFFLCPVCGYVEFGAAPAKCPVCGTLQSKFIKGC